MTDRVQLMSQVWACVEQAFAAGDFERARGLEHYLSVLEDLTVAENQSGSTEPRAASGLK